MQIFIYFSTSTSTKLGQTKAGICSPANTWEKVGISDQDMNPHISPSHPGGRQSRAHTPSSWRRWQTTTVFSSSPSTSSRWENWAFVCLLHQSCPSFPLAGFQATDADLLMPPAVYFYYWTSVFLPPANNCICCTNLAFLDVPEKSFEYVCVTCYKKRSNKETEFGIVCKDWAGCSSRGRLGAWWHLEWPLRRGNNARGMPCPPHIALTTMRLWGQATLRTWLSGRDFQEVTFRTWLSGRDFQDVTFRTPF